MSPMAAPVRNGRATEYAFIRELTSRLHQLEIENQERESLLEQAFLACNPAMRTRLEAAAKSFAEFLLSNLGSDQAAKLTLPNDTDAQWGTVSDLRLTVGLNTFDLSIKHNHDALRHPRIPTWAERLGFHRDSAEEKQFRDEYAGALLDLTRRCGLDLDRTYLYAEHPAYLAGLYDSLGVLLAKWVNLADMPALANVFHQFIFGGDHLTICVKKTYIQVYDYRGLPRPSKMSAAIASPSTITIAFDGRPRLSVRLHRDQRVFQPLKPSIKLDVRDLEPPITLQISYA